MKKNLPLYILILVLAIMNGFFLFNYLGHNDEKPDRRKERNNFMAKKIGFKGKQLDSFKNFEELHRERMRLISGDVRKLKDVFFDKLSDDEVSDSYIDSLTNLIAIKEIDMDKEVFSYFKNVRNLCDDAQKEKFDKIVKDALHRRDKKGKRRSKGDERNGSAPPPTPHEKS